MLEQILRRFGVEQSNPVGQKFDPNRHEALVEVDHDKIQPGHIAFVAQAGYVIGERVLRPAKVAVVKAKPAAEPKKE